MVDPVAVGVEFGLGEGFVKRNGVEFAEFAGLGPGVTLNLEAFKGFGVGKMAKEGVSELVEQEEAEVIVSLKVGDGLGRAKEKFAAGAKSKAGISLLEGF